VIGARSIFAPETYSETMMGAEWIVHPQYNPATLENDIAILRLKGSASSSRTLAIPVFMTENQADYTLPGTNSTLIGWGKTFNSQTYNSILNEATSLVVSHQVCSATHPGLVMENSMFCAGPNEGGVGICFGDSGGPILSTANKNIQIGISSWVMGQTCAQPGDYSGFTRLSAYASFVSDATKCCTSSTSPSCSACNFQLSVQEFCAQCLTNTTKHSSCQSCDIGGLFALSPNVRSFSFGNAEFGPDVKASQIVAPLKYSFDSEGCTQVSFSESATPPIVLIDRGDCSFADKALNAEAAGALGVIIVNNLNSGAILLSAGGDFEDNLTIPTVSISKEDGDYLKQLLLQGEVIMTLGRIQGEQLPTYDPENFYYDNVFESCESKRIPIQFLSTMIELDSTSILCTA